MAARRGGARGPADMYEALGTDGYRRTGGFLIEDFVPELRGLRGRRTYREMADNDPTVGALLFAVRTMLGSVGWTMTPRDEGDDARRAADFATAAVLDEMDTPWRDVVDEACEMFTFGFSALEIVWRPRDAKARRPEMRDRITLAGLEPRPPETVTQWLLDDRGRVEGIRQQPETRSAASIPVDRLVLFRTRSRKNSPEGVSILRNAYRPWYFARRLEEIEAIGIERDLAGYPVMYIPGHYLSRSASADERAVAENYLQQVRSIRRGDSEGVVMPNDRDANGNRRFELSLLSSAGGRTIDVGGAIQRYQRAIATTVLADFIFLGQQSVGSFALSSNKTELFAQAIGTFARVIADAINWQLMPRLWALNGLDPEVMPTLTPGDIERPDLTELANFIGLMVGAGVQMFPDRKLENHLRGLAGLPLSAEEDDTEDDMAAAVPSDGAAEDEV